MVFICFDLCVALNDFTFSKLKYNLKVKLFINYQLLIRNILMTYSKLLVESDEYILIMSKDLTKYTSEGAVVPREVKFCVV